jgi:hypothetical protein
MHGPRVDKKLFSTLNESNDLTNTHHLLEPDLRAQRAATAALPTHKPTYYVS